MLSEAFEAQGVFPKIYTTTLLAGEKSGNMEEVLGRYIAFQRLALTFRKKLVVSLVYPDAAGGALLLVMMMFLITCVVPQFAKLVSGPGCGAAGDHRLHAGDRRQRAEVCCLRDLIGRC